MKQHYRDNNGCNFDSQLHWFQGTWWKDISWVEIAIAIEIWCSKQEVMKLKVKYESSSWWRRTLKEERNRNHKETQVRIWVES